VKRKPDKKAAAGPLQMRFEFPDGYAEIPAAEYEAHQSRIRLEIMTNPAFQELAEKIVTEKAARQHHDNLVAAKRRKSARLAAKARSKLGREKARLVKDELAKGRAPPASDRHVRRIVKRGKRRHK